MATSIGDAGRRSPPEGVADAALELELELAKDFTVEMNSIEGGGKRILVPVTTDDLKVDLEKVLDAQVFKDWVSAVDADPLLYIAAVEIQSVDMFGPRIGFIKFKSRALVNIGGDEGIVEVPGIVFMRGGAVGVLVILECEGEEHTIMTYQARVPVGIHNLPEVPAGMLDGSGNFRGVAADEIAEECDLVISEDELVDLTDLAYGDKWKGMLPSAGGCDEFLRLYMFRRPVEREVLTELEGRLTGLRSEGERIKLHIVPLQDAWKLSPDAKLLSCLTLFDRLKAEGKLPASSMNVAPSSVAELAKATRMTSADLEAEDQITAMGTMKLGDVLEPMKTSSDSQSSIGTWSGSMGSGSLIQRDHHGRSSPSEGSDAGSMSSLMSVGGSRHVGRLKPEGLKESKSTKKRLKEVVDKNVRLQAQLQDKAKRIVELETTTTLDERMVVENVRLSKENERLCAENERLVAALGAKAAE